MHDKLALCNWKAKSFTVIVKLSTAVKHNRKEKAFLFQSNFPLHHFANNKHFGQENCQLIYTTGIKNMETLKKV